MLRFILLLGILCTTSLLDHLCLAQEFTLLPSSKLRIHGSSNVNNFTCSYSMEQFRGLSLKYYPEADQFRTTAMKFPISNFDCGGRIINRDFKEILKEEAYPELGIKLLDVIPITSKKANVTLELEIAGVKREYDLSVYYNNNYDRHSASGKLKLDIGDFNIEQPKRMLGMIVVDREIDIVFQIDFE